MNDRNRRLHAASLAAFALSIALDQWTKSLAVAHLGDVLRDGHLYSDHARRIVGDWVWFFVAYNPGAAFSLSPQAILPFLNPTLFYSLLVAGAAVFLAFHYRRHADTLSRLGCALVLSGALGNVLDRWRLGHVVDFVSVGVPGFLWRWPTFNVADSAICVGVALLVLGEWLVERARSLRASATGSGQFPSGTGTPPDGDAPAA